MIASGVLVGLVTSLGATQLLRSQFSGVSPTDPFTLVVVVMIVVLVGIAACLLPARRAAQVEPLVAIRYE